MRTGLSLAVNRLSGAMLAAQLDLGFLNNSLPSGITFTRADATSCATYFDSTGRLVTQGANLLANSVFTGYTNGVVGSGAVAPTGFVLSGAGATVAFSGEQVTLTTAAAAGRLINVQSLALNDVLMTSATVVSNPASDTLANVLLVSNNIGAVGSVTFVRNGSVVASSTVPVAGDRVAAYATCTTAGNINGIWGSANATTRSLVLSQLMVEKNPAMLTTNAYSQTSGTTTSGPRFDYDPATLLPKGLLIEESRTNLLAQSGLAWGNNAGASHATYANNAVGPDGVANSATTFTESADLGPQYGLLSSATTTAAVHTISAHVKAGSATLFQITPSSVISSDYGNFSLSGGGSVVGGTTPANCGIKALGGGWFRVWMTVTAAAASGSAVVSLISSAADTRLPTYTGTSRTIFVYGAQIELGAFPTSYIPTTTAAVTRAADSASMTGTNFSSWYNQSAGTFVVEGDISQRPSGQFPPLLQADQTSSPSTVRNQIFCNTAASNHTVGARIDNTTNTFNSGNVTTVTFGAAFKFAEAYVSGDIAVCTNGGSLATGAGTGIPATVDRVLLGSNNAPAYLNGHIRRIRYYNTRLPNATLQSLTA